MDDIELTGKRARTHVAMVQEEGQAEPWIIAMSDRPTPGRARDYGLRWGIEAMFSDFKTRGCNREASQIERTDRLDRLVLVLALALYWAVSTGLRDAIENRAPAEKKSRGGAAQEHRPQLDVAVQAWPAAHPVLPSAPHRSAAPLGGLEKRWVVRFGN